MSTPISIPDTPASVIFDTSKLNKKDQDLLLAAVTAGCCTAISSLDRDQIFAVGTAFILGTYDLSWDEIQLEYSIVTGRWEVERYSELETDTN